MLIGAATIAVTVATLVTNAQVVPSLRVTTEAGAGEAPAAPGQEPRLGVSATLAPEGGLRFGRSNVGGQIRYAPRLMWRKPNQLNVERPLLLHSLDLSFGSQHGTVTTQAVLNGTYGQPDYTTLQNILGNMQGALPQVRTLFSSTGTFDISWMATRRSTLALELTGAVRRPVGDPPPPPEMGVMSAGPVLSLDKQNSVIVTPSYAFKITPLDALSTVASLVYDHRPDASYFITSGGFGYTRTLGEKHSLGVIAGLSYVKTSGSSTSAPLAGIMVEEDDTTWAPMALVNYTRKLLKANGTELSAGGTLGVVSVVDPVLRTAGPRLQGQFGLDYGITPRLGLEWQASLSAGVAKRAAPAAGVGMLPDETMAATSLALRYQMSPSFFLTGSLRWSDRGPSLRADDFKFRQRELWGIVGLSYVAQNRPP